MKYYEGLSYKVDLEEGWAEIKSWDGESHERFEGKWAHDKVVGTVYVQFVFSPFKSLFFGIYMLLQLCHGIAKCWPGYNYGGEIRKGEFFTVPTDGQRKRTLLKKGTVNFEESGEFWEGEFFDYKWMGSGFTYKLLGKVVKKGEETGKYGVWNCEDTKKENRIVKYVCDAETWEKLREKQNEEIVDVD